MTDDTVATAGTAQAELGDLLAGAVQAVVSAQDILDKAAVDRVAAFTEAAPGTLALPPLAFAFDAISLELELSSQVTQSTTTTAGGPAQTTLLCRTLNPVTVGLFGYSASTGTRVTLALSPTRVAPAPSASA
jgi:hypothetical protein